MSDFDVKEETELLSQFGKYGLDDLISLYDEDDNKYCVIESAEKYINFMCREDVALANAEYIGYASPISAVKDELDEEATGEFFYPSDEKLKNECEVFSRLSDETNAYLSTKWEDLMKEFTEKTR